MNSKIIVQRNKAMQQLSLLSKKIVEGKLLKNQDYEVATAYPKESLDGKYDTFKDEFNPHNTYRVHLYSEYTTNVDANLYDYNLDLILELEVLDSFIDNDILFDECSIKDAVFKVRFFEKDDIIDIINEEEGYYDFNFDNIKENTIPVDNTHILNEQILNSLDTLTTFEDRYLFTLDKNKEELLGEYINRAWVKYLTKNNMKLHNDEFPPLEVNDEYHYEDKIAYSAGQYGLINEDGEFFLGFLQFNKFTKEKDFNNVSIFELDAYKSWIYKRVNRNSGRTPSHTVLSRTMIHDYWNMLKSVLKSNLVVC